MVILLFLAGLGLSSISAVYAVVGLLSIFPAAPLTITIMASALEFSKLVIASWLYRNWKEIPRLLKVYFSAALVILMLLTSMAVFGYLSKAHMDSSIETGGATSALAVIDEKIATQKENIAQDRKALSQMDAAVNEMMGRTTDDQGASKAVKIRKQQQTERSSLAQDIAKAQSEISVLQEQRAPVAAQVRKVEAEVGPIKYIANLIYGDKIDDTLLEKAVRVVILLIVFVFDPLAVLLLIAANWQLKNLPPKPKTIITKHHVETVEDTIETIEVPTANKEYKPSENEFPFGDEVFLSTEPMSDEDFENYIGENSGPQNIEVAETINLDEHVEPHITEDYIPNSENVNFPKFTEYFKNKPIIIEPTDLTIVREEPAEEDIKHIAKDYDISYEQAKDWLMNGHKIFDRLSEKDFQDILHGNVETVEVPTGSTSTSVGIDNEINTLDKVEVRIH